MSDEHTDPGLSSATALSSSSLLRDIRDRVIRMEVLIERYERHDDRIRALENWRWFLAGGLALAGVGIGLLARVIP